MRHKNIKNQKKKFVLFFEYLLGKKKKRKRYIHTAYTKQLYLQFCQKEVTIFI